MYGEVDGSNRPRELWPISSARVTPELAPDDNGRPRLLYKIQRAASDGGDLVLPSRRVLHIRGLGDEMCG